MAKKLSVNVEIDVDDIVSELINKEKLLDYFTVSEIVDYYSIETLLDEIGQDKAVEHFGLTIQE